MLSCPSSAGGKIGYDKVEWDMEAVESDKGKAVRFSYQSWDGEEVSGHPPTARSTPRSLHSRPSYFVPNVALDALPACLPACRASPATSSCQSPTR